MNSLDILGKHYQIEWVDELDDALGITYSSKQLIKMVKDLPVDTERETLLHEVIHAVEDGMGLNLTEAQVHGLACGLYAVLKNNATTIKKYYGTIGTSGGKARSTS